MICLLPYDKIRSLILKGGVFRNNYIFLTDEGYTYQPKSESDVPDIENLQAIGITHGESPKQAFYNLIRERKYLLETSFDKIFCYKLSSNYKDSYCEFSMSTRVLATTATKEK